jgi:hypothetical protein
VDERKAPHHSVQERAVLVAFTGVGWCITRDVVDREDDAVVELDHPRDAVEVDLLQLCGPHLTRLPWHCDANRHQAQVAMDADDPVLPAHPLSGVVGDANDDLQVRRLNGFRRSRRDGEGEQCEQQESETAHRLTQQQG